MGTWNGIYIRLTIDPAAVTNAVHEEFPDAELETKGEFLGANLGDDAYEAPEGKLSTLSARLNSDVIFLGFQSAVDAFQFYHWRGGQIVRRLVYGCFVEERTWEKADGVFEPWEQKAFFDPKALDAALKYTESQADKETLRQIWRDRVIEPGKTEPSLDAKSAAWCVAEHYQLPHF